MKRKGVGSVQTRYTQCCGIEVRFEVLVPVVKWCNYTVDCIVVYFFSSFFE